MTLVQIVRIPPDGVAAFQQFESRVLPLLPAYGAAIDRRLRSADGCIEVHVLSFPSQDALDRYRADPARVAALPLLEQSGATSELIDMADVVS
jgi:hypothetical protein